MRFPPQKCCQQNSSAKCWRCCSRKWVTCCSTLQKSEATRMEVEAGAKLEAVTVQERERDTTEEKRWLGGSTAMDPTVKALQLAMFREQMEGSERKEHEPLPEDTKLQIWAKNNQSLCGKISKRKMKNSTGILRSSSERRLKTRIKEKSKNTR